MKKSIICFLIMLSCFFCFVPSVTMMASAQESNFKISAKSALLIEYSSGNIIFEKNADERLPIASMTKLASLAVIFDYMKKDIVKENDMVLVSKTAAATGGSSAFIDKGSMYKVTDLIKTMIVASANDSTVAMAEHVAGSESAFVSKMNKMAADLGLKNTHFENSTGLPHDNHYSTARDLTVIYKKVCNNEIYKKYSKIWMDDFIHPSGRKTGLTNTNRLIKTYDGIEGGKTGFTNSARFCLTASAARGNMRLIGVVIGVDDSKTRFKEMSTLFDYGFSNYQNKMVSSKDVPVTIARFKHAKKAVEVYPKHDIVRFMQKNDDETFTTDFKIDEVKAPLKSGDVVGKLFVFDKNNMVVEEVELVVKQNIDGIGVKETLRKIVQAW